MYCCQCGKEIEEGSLYCSHCGAAQHPSQEFRNQGTLYNQNPQYYQPNPSTFYSQPNNKYVPSYNYVRPVYRELNSFCLVGLILSCLSVVFFGFALSLSGLILSIFGLNDCKRKNQDGQGLAIAGIVISSVILVLKFFVFLCVFISFLSLFFESGGGLSTL